MVQLVRSGSFGCTQTEQFCDAHGLRIIINLPGSCLMIIKVSVSRCSTRSSDIPTQQILLHCELIETRVDMRVWLEEIDDLLWRYTTLEGWLEGLASQTRHHQVWERILHFHQVLQEGQVNFGASVGIDLEVGLNDDELVRISCISALATILIAFINKHGLIIKQSGLINTHRLASRIHQELLKQTGHIEFYSISLNLFRVQYLDQPHHCEVWQYREVMSPLPLDFIDLSRIAQR